MNIICLIDVILVFYQESELTTNEYVLILRPLAVFKIANPIRKRTVAETSMHIHFVLSFCRYTRIRSITQMTFIYQSRSSQYL